MRRYLNHIHSKPTHERRTHAMQVAGVITGLLVVGWVTTLGARLSTPSDTATLQATNSGAQTSLTAAAAQSVPESNEPRLEVSTTSVFTLPQY